MLRGRVRTARAGMVAFLCRRSQTWGGAKVVYHPAPVPPKAKLLMLAFRPYREKTSANHDRLRAPARLRFSEGAETSKLCNEPRLFTTSAGESHEDFDRIYRFSHYDLRWQYDPMRPPHTLQYTRLKHPVPLRSKAASCYQHSQYSNRLSGEWHQRRMFTRHQICRCR